MLLTKNMIKNKFVVFAIISLMLTSCNYAENTITSSTIENTNATINQTQVSNAVISNVSYVKPQNDIILPNAKCEIDASEIIAIEVKYVNDDFHSSSCPNSRWDCKHEEYTEYKTVTYACSECGTIYSEETSETIKNHHVIQPKN